jgi:gamma-glutamyltranspeptidase/glutathione hydrolase
MISLRVLRHAKGYIAVLLTALALAACTTAGTAQPEPAAKGLVSAADPRAAEAGAEMLRQGGSATDAAIATMLALTVVEPQSSGIGGGGFYLFSDPDGPIETLDGREAAPAAAGPEWFIGEDGKPLPFMQAVLSGKSVGVPGNVALAAEAHRRHGKLKWARLFTPAIRLARDGFAISPRLREFLERARNRAAADAEGQGLFYDELGEPLPVGTVVKNEALAKTFERIAREGPDGFYKGENATAVAVRVWSETPGARGMVEGDLASYTARDRPPLCGEYRVYRICGMGPPSSGATTVYAILKQLERFDLGALGPQSAQFWHLFAESQRLAYADREQFIGDPDFVKVPAAGLMNADYLASRGALIDPAKTLGSVTAGTPPGPVTVHADGDEPTENGTSHFVAIDNDGNAVSYTSTVEGSFGSGIVVGGYYLNNELTDFSFTPEADGKPVANRVESGKRPRSSMAPTLVYGPDGKLLLAVGAAGGSTIPAQVARAIIGVLDFRLTVNDAVALPVLFSPGDTISVEAGTSLETLLPQLQALGHQAAARPMPLKTNAAERTAAGWVGAADPRSEGAVATE